MPDSLYETDALAWAERQAESPSASHWKTEIVGFLRTARKRFAPSMRQRIDLREIFEDMVFQIRVGANGERDPRLPACCPFTLDDLLDPRPDVMALAARLEPARLGPLAPHEEAEHGG
jgi:hypothetical protein